MEKYQITVGMPVYGVEKYIRKSISSVLNQNFDNMEILCVDDLGPDYSMDIVREIKATHPKGDKIRIITQPKNMGCWAARNRIIDESQGKYLFLIDSDDYIAEDTLKLLYDTAEKNQAETVYGSVESVKEDGTPANFSSGDMKLPYKELLKPNELASYANQNLHATLYNFIWNVLIRIDFIRNNHLRFQNTRYGDDIIFETDMQPLVNRAVLLPNITYYYVLRPGSLSNFQIREKIKLEEINTYIKNYNYIKNQVQNLKDKPYYEIRCAKVLIYMFYIIAGAIKNRDKIYPHLTDKMICEAMSHPIQLHEILKFRQYRNLNILFSLMAKLPPFLAVKCYTLIGKRKHLL